MGDDAEAPAGEEPACPPGCEPCDVMMKDLEKHGLKNGPNLSDLVAYKLFNYKEAMEEVQNIGFYSIFFNYKKQLSKYPEDQVSYRLRFCLSLSPSPCYPPPLHTLTN